MKTYFLLASIFLLFNKPAFAYLDPGSASLAIQAILAVIAGGLATIKLWWNKFTSLFKRSSPSDEHKD